MNDLSELLRDCKESPPAKAPSAALLDKAHEVEGLGFERLARDLRAKYMREERMECIAKYKYIVITEDKIKAFLDRKAVDYNKKHSMGRNTSSLTQSYGYGTNIASNLFGAEVSALANQIFMANHGPTATVALSYEKSLSAPTCHWMSTDLSHISGFTWHETPIKNYTSLPPASVLASLKEHKARDIFDDFTVATVKHMRDPLLLGCVKDSADRYFVAQWGDDISLDDVI